MDILSNSEILYCISHIQVYLFTVHMTFPSDPSVNKVLRDLYRQNLLPVAYVAVVRRDSTNVFNGT